MPNQPFIKRLLILRYKYISQKNFVFLLSILIGLLAGLVSVTIKNITFFIQWLLEKSEKYFEGFQILVLLFLLRKIQFLVGLHQFYWLNHLGLRLLTYGGILSWIENNSK